MTCFREIYGCEKRIEFVQRELNISEGSAGFAFAASYVAHIAAGIATIFGALKVSDTISNALQPGCISDYSCTSTTGAVLSVVLVSGAVLGSAVVYPIISWAGIKALGHCLGSRTYSQISEQSSLQNA